jgi:hypothetical protein
MLEGVRRQEQVDATVLAEDVLEFLRGLWSDSEHDIPESFRSYMKENEGKAFNGVLLEQFKKEITKDQEVFNSFTADFLTKIYKKSDVDRVFPRVISPKLVGFRSRSLV